MSNFYKSHITVIVGIFILAIQSFSQVQENNVDTSSKISESACREIKEFFVNSLTLSKKQGGLIILKNDCSQNLVFPEYEPKELSLAERLNLIVQMNPKLKWKSEEGVINMTSERIPDFFDTQISSFRVESTDNLTFVLNELLKTPEVADIIKKQNLKRGVQFGGLQPRPSTLPPSTTVYGNKTFKDILNEIVKKRGRGIWVYWDYNLDGEEFFNIDFISQ